VRHVYFSALMFTALLTSVIQGATTEIRVLSPPLVEAALEDLASAYTKETGTTVTLKSDVMGRIMNTIQTDTPAADVILLPVNLMDSLEKDGGVKPGTS
jgi:ABC-type molybdate transport system substrate-binding protein